MARACIQAVRPQTNLAGLAPLGVEAGKSVGISPEEPRLRKSAGLMNMIEGTRSPAVADVTYRHVAVEVGGGKQAGEPRLRSMLAQSQVGGSDGSSRCVRAC